MGSDFTFIEVPKDKRKSFFSILIVLLASVICVSSLYTGSEISKGLSTKDVLISVLLGNLILSFFACSFAYIGAKEHLSTAMISRNIFGNKGSKITSFIFAIVITGWFSVQLGFFGEAVNSLIPNHFLGSNQNAIIWGGILMTLTPFFGFKGLEILSKIAVPFLIIICLLAIYKISSSQGFTVLTESTLNLNYGITAVVGSWTVGAVLIADITRYSRNVKEAVLSTFTCFFIGNSFVVLAGYLLMTQNNSADLPAAMMTVGLGAFSVLVLILSQWTTNDSNLYFSSLSFSNIYTKLNKKIIVLILGTIGTVLAYYGITDSFLSFLINIGIIFPAFAGVMIVDYFLNKYFLNYNLKEINKSAFFSIISGSLLGYFINFSIPSIISSLASGLIYYLLRRFYK